MTRPRLALLLTLALSACGGAQVSPPPSVPTDATASIAPTVSQAPAIGQVVPAPGSDGEVYAPDPGAIMVALDPGHGGCLDWGVPNPFDNAEERSEKMMTLGIARALREQLEGEGIQVVLARDEDEALAGDFYPDLGCEGPPFRDVNGDGLTGFGADLPEGTLARDELQARLDLANVARADAFVSIHINSPFDSGATIEVAFTETFYTDETPWGVEVTERLARAVQAGVVDAFAGVAYEHGDRGITAHNFYLVAPPLFELTPQRTDPLKQPTRGALMPAVLSEAGSITLEAEAELLASAEGQQMVADGLFAGLVEFFADRPRAARIDPLSAGTSVADVLTPVDGEGPPFWAPLLPEPEDGVHRLSLRLTNNGTEAWRSGLELVAGWERLDEPYLRAAPASLTPLEVEVPALAPGESVELSVPLSSPGAGRWLVWLTLTDLSQTFADMGSPPLQLATD